MDDDYDGAVYKVIKCNTETRKGRRITTVYGNTLYFRFGETDNCLCDRALVKGDVKSMNIPVCKYIKSLFC